MDKNPVFKLPELSISNEDPWADDALDRPEIADRLRDFIAHQSEPFVVSLNGHWGTGKTFFLKRWKVHLEKKGFKVIYFNAWEDDFIDDPLIALISELSSLMCPGKDKKLGEDIRSAAIPLISNNIRSLLRHYTGLTLDGWENKAFESYSTQTKSKKELKDRLEALCRTLKNENDLPLVFIIDELDRCRPSFAIELLERVKHIFDIPGIVFVFGINRDELCASIKSIYGEIQSDIYIRRFFDMEFALPDTGIEKFVRHAIREYKLKDLFGDLTDRSDNINHEHEFANFSALFTQLSRIFKLSFRDIDFCLRTVSLVGGNLAANHFMYPDLVGVIIPLRLKHEGLYRRFLEGKKVAPEIVDYITSMEPKENGEDMSGRDLSLEFMEAYLYLVAGGDLSEVQNQLHCVASGEEPSDPKLLSIRSKTSGRKYAERILGTIDEIRGQRKFGFSGTGEDITGHIRGLLELVQTPGR